ncbi:M48 family metalloprotease [Candidatus Bathyarchaeota archaeon]|nr:M48 family metalloprotease [Candidatus Bathyarchaeota archaeon]
MMTWLDPISDLTQPFFFYSITFTILFALLTYIILRILGVHDPRFKSYFYMIPLFIPLVIYAIFPPFYLAAEISFASFTSIADMPAQAKIESISLPEMRFNAIPPFKPVHLEVFKIQVLSLTGLLCFAGLIASMVLLVFLYLFGNRIVCWLQGIVELSPEENPELAAMVNKLAQRAGISIPRIGITEDLRPNAFTIGYGKDVMIVFSLGLLKILEDAELEAVISHEIGHIKNQDFHFNALISALKTVSFFNPLAYLLASAIKREREFLADNTGMKLIKKPWIFGKALKKVWEASNGSSGGLLKQWVSSFFIVSELRHQRNFLATHPTLKSRLSNIADSIYHRSAGRDETLRAILSCTIIMMIVISVCGLLAWTRYPIALIHIPAKEISVAPNKGGYRLKISDIPNICHKRQFECRTFNPERAAEDESESSFTIESSKQLNTSPLYFYISISSTRYQPIVLPRLSQVSGSTYSWVITSTDIVVMAIILFLSCHDYFRNAIKKLKKIQFCR